MFNQHVLLLALFASSFVLILTGSWMLYRQLRNGPSKLFVASLCAYSAYTFFSQDLLRAAIRFSDPAVMDFVVWAMNALAPAVLLLLVAIAFWLTIRSATRPNNSFKPTPLRGAA